MRSLIRDFAKICSQTLNLSSPVYEFGSYQVPGQDRISNLRPLFPGKTYIGADFRPGDGVDVVLDLHKIDLPSGSVGTILCFETLEHVEFPWKAMEGMHRVLREGGILAISSVMNHPIHNHPCDYWRFTPEAIRSLLRPFKISMVECAGDNLFPHTVVGIGIKSDERRIDLGEFSVRLAEWKETWSRPHALWVWQDWVKSLVPPLLVDLAKSIGSRR